MKFSKLNGNLVLSISALMVSIAALFINYKNNQRQIRLSIEHQKMQSLIALGQYLHEPSFSDARSMIRNNKISPHITDTSVRRVCSSFGFAGSLVRNEAVDKDKFLDYWASAIIIFDRTLPKSFWDEDASSGLGIKASDYYSDFLWLIREANATERYNNIKNREDIPK